MLIEVVGFPGGDSGKEPVCQYRRHKRHNSISVSGKSLGEGNGNPLQCTLGNPMDREAWWAAVHRVAESQTQLKQPRMKVVCIEKKVRVEETDRLGLKFKPLSAVWSLAHDNIPKTQFLCQSNVTDTALLIRILYKLRDVDYLGQGLGQCRYKQNLNFLPYLFILFLCLYSTSPAFAAKSHQSCLTLCDPIDSSPPGSSVPGILQARTLEWVPHHLGNWLFSESRMVRYR